MQFSAGFDFFFTCYGMTTVNSAPPPEKQSQSTLLIGEDLYDSIIKAKSLKGKRLVAYLHQLLNDPGLELKLRHLKPKKWKTQYQDEGQALVPVYFFPDECDWARLSQISFATGFSRCYLFVYLMLLDMGILKLRENITIDIQPQKNNKNKFISVIILEERKKKLLRILKIQPESEKPDGV